MMERLFDRWVFWMKARGSWKMIRRDGTVEYLERFFLLSIAGRALFLHCFWSSDQDGLHCHPWWWARLILKGGYFERGLDGIKQWYGPWSFGLNSPERVHAVTLPDELIGKTWTLFWHGKRSRLWGFIDLDDESPQWHSAESGGNQDKREKRGWLFPRYV